MGGGVAGEWGDGGVTGGQMGRESGGRGGVCRRGSSPAGIAVLQHLVFPEVSVEGRGRGTVVWQDFVLGTQITQKILFLFCFCF